MIPSLVLHYSNWGEAPKFGLCHGGHVLVLTRKVGEKINIGDDIILTVLEIGRTSVKLGIDAPKSVGIFREELYERIKEENLMSSQGTPTDIAEASRLLREKGF